MNPIKVRDYMVRQPVTFTPEMSLTAALEKVINSEHLGGPVLDTKGAVVGFISEQDLLEKLIKVSYDCQDTYLVGDCMHKEVLSVSPELGIIELAEMMKVGKPKVYPVIEEGKLLGIITRRDVLQAIEKNIQTCFKHPV
ncbi:hypothetical protein CSW98_03170 [Vibrio sp. HA2012]|uniref:CBS domain-containing protein n=1 Tax=Vibrio sp. HA2012 TaxID=1971595 RepID=UPI000C2BCB09|nr:CBS domain-containing protein [Vibrio sp. HA2012]PJC88136.1 hypothetical protein CSW98_03170 [Vibrio sp. HA2012]